MIIQEKNFLVYWENYKYNFSSFFKVDFANIFYLCFFFFSFTVSFNYLYKLIYIDLINTKCMRRHIQAEPNKRYFASIKAIDKIQSIQYKCQNVSYKEMYYIRKIFFAFPFYFFHWILIKSLYWNRKTFPHKWNSQYKDKRQTQQFCYSNIVDIS